jgi:hypothetical protein
VAHRGCAFPPYVSVLLGEAEADASGARSSRSSPRSASSDRLRNGFDDLLTKASDELSTLRIPARRAELEALSDEAADLPRLAAELDAFGVTLGALTAMGGFIDIGDIVANAETGARFGVALAWAVVLGVIGICVFAEMAGRVAAVSRRPVFDLVRERLGAKVGLVKLSGSWPGGHAPRRRSLGARCSTFRLTASSPASIDRGSDAASPPVAGRPAAGGDVRRDQKTRRRDLGRRASAL